MSSTNVQARSALDWIDEALGDLDAAQLLRRLRINERLGPVRCRIDGRKLIDFGSNDYLGLAAEPRVIEAAGANPAHWGSAASPLVGGHTPSHERLARKLAEFEGTQAALVFASGYAANVGAITSLVGKGDVIYSDELNHASIIDGCRLSRAAIRPYTHGNATALAELMADDSVTGRRLIVTDSLFSMDGDAAPLVELAELADKHGAMLMVDEAHATGVFGRTGRGLCEELGIEERVHIRVGTLSKALGSVGGFVSGRRSLIEWLINRARPYVFSTAHPAAACEAAEEALSILMAQPERGHELQARAAKLREKLYSQGWNLGPSTSQVIPLIAGGAETALELSQALFQQGFFVPAIRPPSVPAGESRLRISLSWAHTPDMIEAFSNSLSELRRRTQ